MSLFNTYSDIVPINEIANQYIIFLPINYFNKYWKLIIILNLLDNETKTKVLF